MGFFGCSIDPVTRSHPVHCQEHNLFIYWGEKKNDETNDFDVGDYYNIESVTYFFG